ncbi:MAG: thioredoxin-dependent thiol peroxidase [Aquiluna sp.]|nr:thioredoxin-dependent thiol peroxidase [Aquiluna sp.]MCF8546155.1 thioredoxin-dependent thiol peroxidase [Aquiluna sp.]
MSENKLEVGQSAPDFTLLNQDESEISLSGFKGQKVILYFYPAAATPGCTTQACDFRDNLNSLKSAGYAVLGISPDKPVKLKKFQEKESLNFELLSDPENEIQKLYGTYGLKSMYGKEYLGTIRSTIVIDENGQVTLPLYNVKAKGHVAMLRGKLDI